MQGQDNRDIIVGTVPFNGNRYNTAYVLEEVLQNRMGHLIFVDILRNTNRHHKYCLAFVRLSKTSQHQKFVDEFNGRVISKGITLMIKMSRSPRKEFSQEDLENDIGWYYHREYSTDQYRTDQNNSKQDINIRHATAVIEPQSNINCLEELIGLSKVNQEQVERIDTIFKALRVNENELLEATTKVAKLEKENRLLNETKKPTSISSKN